MSDPKVRAAKNKKGRPSLYTKELAARICIQISDGMSLKDVCAQPDMPHRDTVYAWMVDHEGFSGMYARAQEDRAETLADEMLSIADNSDLDPNDRKVRLDTRKWIASKLKPGKYGDRVINSGDKDNPVIHKVTFEVVKPEDPSSGGV